MYGVQLTFAPAMKGFFKIQIKRADFIYTAILHNDYAGNEKKIIDCIVNANEHFNKKITPK